MRRKEKEITEESEIEEIIKRSIICRLGLCDEGVPYIVPLCFGYRNRTIFVHSASEGRKIDILKKNINVCFEFEADVEIKKGATPCAWGMRFQSIMGNGTASFIEDEKEKKEALEIIMSQYSEGDFEFAENAARATSVIRIDIENMTGKRSGF